MAAVPVAPWIPGASDDMHRDMWSAATECASIGDFECALFLMHQMRRCHVADPLDDTCLDPFFVPEAGSSLSSGFHDTVERAQPSLKPRWRTFQEKTQERHGLASIASMSSPSHSAKLPHLKACPSLVTSAESYSSGGCSEVEEEDTASSWLSGGSFKDGAVQGWESLPAELLQRIVQSLAPEALLRACGVCPAWALGLHHNTQHLSLAWCQSESVNALLHSLLPKFKGLSAISLRRCTKLGDSGMAAVATAALSLQSLLLCMCSRVTDGALLRLAACCHNLKVLDLSACKGVTDTGLAAVARGCPVLRELGLCGCPQAGTDTALEALGSSCGGLQVLNLGWCDRVSDRGVAAIARGCPLLRALDLCGCSAITDSSVAALAARCPGLQSLNLHCCRRITDIAIHALTARAVACRGDAAAAAWLHGLARCGEPEEGPGPGFGASRAEGYLLPPAPSSWGQFHTVLHQDLPPPSNGGGLISLNISGCLSLRHDAVQALCNASPSLHTCPSLRSLNLSGCMALVHVHCRCVRGAHPAWI